MRQTEDKPLSDLMREHKTRPRFQSFFLLEFLEKRLINLICALRYESEFVTLEHFDEKFAIHEFDWWYAIAPRLFLGIQGKCACGYD